jgi:hypothetical protein
MHFTAKGNVVIAQRTARATTAHVGVRSFRKFEKHRQNHSNLPHSYPLSDHGFYIIPLVHPWSCCLLSEIGETHVKFMYCSATRHNSPNNPPTFSSPFLAAALTTVRESCKREQRGNSERVLQERAKWQQWESKLATVRESWKREKCDRESWKREKSNISERVLTERPKLKQW